MTAASSILVPVDGSPASDRAAAFAAKQAKAMPGMVVHLLNVQASVGNLVTSFVPKETVDAHRREEGEKALASAARICADAGVPCEKHIGVGRPGEVIGQFARKLGAAAVVTGTRGHSGVAGVLMGSVAQDIVAHVDVPITLVK
jgi:nucleotide-binding universal stress UspA family protein